MQVLFVLFSSLLVFRALGLVGVRAFATWEQSARVALAAMFFVGWLVTGVFPLFMATVPSESIDPRHIASALGICMGSGELIGGVLSPFIAGYSADISGLQAPLWIMLGLALAAGLVALGVRETAPRFSPI